MLRSPYSVDVRRLPTRLAIGFMALSALLRLTYYIAKPLPLPGMLLHLCNNLLSFVQVLLVGAGYGSLAALLGGICLVVFPQWAVVTLLILRRRKTLRWRPLRPGASPAALLDCREWRFTVLVLLAASVLEAVAL